MRINNAKMDKRHGVGEEHEKDDRVIDEDLQNENTSGGRNGPSSAELEISLVLV